MIRGFYNARSGLIAHQDRLNVISNNIANVNTVGFKPMRTAFKDLIYQNLNRRTAENEVQTGHGVKVNKNDILISQGAPAYTGRELDLTLIGENNFFAVQTRGGEIRYTRSGNFSWNNDDGTWYLVNGNGERLLDSDWQVIEAQPDDNGKLPSFNGMGELMFPGSADVEAEAGIFSFSNPFGLWSMEGTTFYPTPESGPALQVDPQDRSLVQAYLENSSVEIAHEMVSMIEAQRAFSFNSRMVQTADEVEQIVNSLR
ncbi:MAG: flagellar hook-basal body protein [Oscillospiraceae bacterium]|nr:flagellar hook-basal body protein [Oscillospiraceae bacterium]